VPDYGMREHMVEGVNVLKVYTIPTLLQYSWREGYRADIKVVTRQALTNTVYHKLLNLKATRWKEAQTVAASLR